VKVPGKDEIFKLAEHEDTPSITLYMSSPRPHDPKKSQIRFKTLLGQAEESLGGSDLRPQQKEALLSDTRSLLSNSMFWEQQSEGIAVFMARDFSRVYRLPIAMKDLVTVSDRFHIKPLLPLLGWGGEYFVLCLSQKQIRLLQCTRDSVREMDLENVPESISEALQYELSGKQGQFSGGHDSSGPFHTHGVGEEDVKGNIRRFFRRVDEGLQKVLKNEKSPLVTAGISYLASIFREANTYTHLVEESIEGNPEAFDARELQQKAWKIVKPIFERARTEAGERYGDLQGTGKTSDRLEEIVPASVAGRVDTLFVSLKQQVWGRYDPEAGSIEIDASNAYGNRDLLDMAAVRTLESGGTVYALEADEVPGGGELAAIFRY